MKRDDVLVGLILEFCEPRTQNIASLVAFKHANYSGREIQECVIQMIDAGYLIGRIWSTAPGKENLPSPRVYRVSWSGLGLLDEMRKKSASKKSGKIKPA